VALASLGADLPGNTWAQVPFCGSLVIRLFPCSQWECERFLFKTSDIPKIIDFIKETGKLQVALTTVDPHAYSELDYLDPFFEELKPPVIFLAPVTFASKKEVQKAVVTFDTIGGIRYLNWLEDFCTRHKQRFSLLPTIVSGMLETYTFLKLARYAVVEDIENLMVDNPAGAFMLLKTCGLFIHEPIADLRFDLRNFTLEDIKKSQVLPLVYRPKKMRFPCEIGEFLLKKLTYAPYRLDACKELMYHYDAYDLQKVLESLNKAIVGNHPDVISKSVEELSEILEIVWKDATIPKRIKGIKIGVPLLMAVVGYAVAGPLGAVGGGLLAELGFNVADKTVGALFDSETSGLSEKLAKLRTKSYQANIYDFKKKYKGKITTS